MTMSEAQAMYTVMGVSLLAWGAVFLYLLRLDHRIRELEKR